MTAYSSRLLTAAEVRQQFIAFFEQRARHTFVASSPVIPYDDPTLLFTNAGMNQFKPIFLGQVDPSSPLASLKRAVNSQKCIRAGGKHNDLDDVGKDTYHHTFFEMLGNWSFGDYFKPEAIQWAWELLTEIWGLDPDRLYATYFEGNRQLGLDPDREAYDLWSRYLPAQRILPGNMKDNFWEMGETGPCGPCSEIHYDGRSDEERKRVPGHDLVNRESPDVIEVWNLVFIQFNRTGPESLTPLPAKHVDTGMGFERIVRVLQGKTSNYDTDVFTGIFRKITEITCAREYTGSLTDQTDIAYRVLADHIRTLCIAIADGGEPSNDGRGYVLRRILRRAVRFGRQVMGVQKPFLAELIPPVIESLGSTFPELRKAHQRIAEVLTDEEEAFGRTLDQGIRLFESAAEEAQSRPAGRGHLTVTAESAFKLHDTYGFPIDLTQLMAEERGLTVDVDGFNQLMEEARERSRAGSSATDHAQLLLPGSAIASLQSLKIKPTDDIDKYHGRDIRANLVAIWNGTDFDQDLVASNTRPADRFALVFDRTCFYAEQGGQVADTGRIVGRDGTEFIVEDVRACAGYIVHIGRVTKGRFVVGDRCELCLNTRRRLETAANHTATHLLNLALRNTLGEHVQQKGSLVAPDRLRFDFSHNKSITPEEFNQINRVVTLAITGDLPVYAELTSLKPARTIGTLRAVFGETYPDPVRVVSIGVPIAQLLEYPEDERWQEYSVEFCGGTHIPSTGLTQAFAIVSEESVSKGVRRIVALTRDGAAAAIDRAEKLIARAKGAQSLPDKHLAPEVAELQQLCDGGEMPIVQRNELRTMLDQLQERVKGQSKQAAREGAERAIDAAKKLAEDKAGVTVIVGEIPAGSDRNALLAALDTVRGNSHESAILLASRDLEEGKVSIVASVPEGLIKRGLKAGDWVRAASQACGGKGGGRPDAAQGGGTQPEKLDDALDVAHETATSLLST